MIRELRIFSDALGTCVASQRQIQLLRSLIREMKEGGITQKKTEAAMDELLNCMLDHQSDRLRNMKTLFLDITGDDMHKRFKKMYGKS